MVKHLPAMGESQVQSLGQEDPLEKETATHSSTPVLLPGKSHGREAQYATVHRVAKSWTQLSNLTFIYDIYMLLYNINIILQYIFIYNYCVLYIININIYYIYFSIIGYYKILNTVPCIIHQVPVDHLIKFLLNE